MKPTARKRTILTYDQTRDREQLAVHERVIDDFIARYKGSRPRQSLFFFPGGMACQLKRSTKAFKDGVANPPFRYRLKWLNCLSLLGSALQLGMQKDPDGIFRDKGNRIVVADGAVNLRGHTPHDGLIDWCADNEIALFVFNWDWRRRQEDAARFFVERFWPLFKTRVHAAGIAQTARNFSLLGHSFGGMVVNLILRGDDPAVGRRLRRAITVATPFYGYASQAHRWFEGESYLNGDGHEGTVKMIKVIASMPGLYVLHYLDLDRTFRRDGPVLAKGTFPLGDYPSLDAPTQSRFDPWAQETDGYGRVRYPLNMGFQTDELAYSRHTFRRMAAPLDDKRFFNIRGVQLARRRRNARNDTVGSVKCGWIPRNFHPDQGSPIIDDAKVPGDGTQPAWTAHLASNDPRRCLTVAGEDVEHMFLMNDAGTLQELARILLGAKAARTSPIRARPAPRLADDGEINNFLASLRAYKKKKSRGLPSEAAIQKDLPPEVKNNLPRIARRIIEDILKRPGPART